uniref:Gypsy retrotransposon integrase-like protein 1 n=1 Tax=Salarias fasciatus TaxID=181472 RepID=A0A672GNT3_SALFA
MDKQRADQCIRHVISQLEHGDKPPPTLRDEIPDLAFLLRELNRLELLDNVLYRRRQEGSKVTYQLVLPAELRDAVLTSLHDDMGHMGVGRTMDLVRTRFYWPRMAADVEKKVRTCGRCVRRKSLPERAAPLVNIKTTRPLELLCMDFLSLEPDRSGMKDILVITDHFTKYAVAIPTPNQKARTVAKCLWENFMVHYGMPEKLHSDQGPDFESRLIKELCQIAGIQKVRTTPYHPRGNPVERFNRTLLDMLGTLQNKDKSRWRDFVKPLVHAYNCSRNDVTGFTPYELMFGRQPRLPVDLAFGLPVQNSQHVSHSDYVRNLKSQLEESYKIAMKNAAKIAQKNKTRFDRRVTASDLEVGDRVLVRNVRIRGKHKISDKWESIVHVVTSRAGTLP